MDNIKKESIITAGSAACGFATYFITKKGLNKGSRYITKKLKFASRPKNIEKFKIACNNLFEDKFKDKGIKIFDLSNTENYNRFYQNSTQGIIKHFDMKISKAFDPVTKYFLSRQKKQYLKRAAWRCEEMHSGRNACYDVISNQVIINMDKSPQFLPHELGHSIDYSNRLLKTSMITFFRNKKVIKNLVGSILGISLFMPEKTSQDKKTLEDNPFYKGLTFIKDNCGKLTTLVFLPYTIEEWAASIHGQKMAKKYFDKIDLKSITRSHIMSAFSYLTVAASAGLAVFAANKVRDKYAQVAEQKFSNGEKPIIIDLYNKFLNVKKQNNSCS